MDLDKVIRKVKDHPKPGILFYDITGLLESPEALSYVTKELAKIAKKYKADMIAGIEARGFIFASTVAYEAKIPLILVRKEGKLPLKVIKKSFDLEYGSATICLQDLDFYKGKRVLVLDDLLATGGTVKATCELFEEKGANIVAVASVIALDFLNYKNVLKDYKIESLINYDSEKVK